MLNIPSDGGGSSESPERVFLTIFLFSHLLGEKLLRKGIHRITDAKQGEKNREPLIKNQIIGPAQWYSG